MHVSAEGVTLDALSADFFHDPDIMYDAEFDYSSHHNYYSSNNNDESEIEVASVNAVTKDDGVGDSLHNVNPSIGKTTRSSKRQRHPLNSDSDELTKNHFLDFCIYFCQTHTINIITCIPHFYRTAK